MDCNSAMATIIFATRTGLAIHHDVIEILHLMGAQDDRLQNWRNLQELAGVI